MSIGCRRVMIALLAVWYAGSPALTLGQELTCAVLTFEPRADVSVSEAEMLTDRFAVEFARSGPYTIIARSKMIEILDMQSHRPDGAAICSTAACAVEAGLILQVRVIIYGSIGRVGNIFSINGYMVDVETGAVLRSTSVDQPGGIEDVLTSGMRRTALALLEIQDQPELKEDESVPPKDDPGLVHSDHEAEPEGFYLEAGRTVWEVGPEVYYYTYEEPGLMDLEGFLYGVAVRFTHYLQPRPPAQEPAPDHAEEIPVEPEPPAKPSQWLLRGEFRWATGKHDYDGGLQDGTPYAIKGMDAMSHEGRFLVGFSRPQPDRMTILYSGLGYRYKEDDSSDPASYKRESRYLYMPLGVEHLRERDNGDQWRVALEYNLFLSGTQKSDLTQFGLWNVENDQDSGFGVRASGSYTRLVGRRVWSIEPFLRYWKIDDSEIVLIGAYPYVIGLLEPENKTLEAGVTLRMQF